MWNDTAQTAPLTGDDGCDLSRYPLFTGLTRRWTVATLVAAARHRVGLGPQAVRPLVAVIEEIERNAGPQGGEDWAYPAPTYVTEGAVDAFLRNLDGMAQPAYAAAARRDPALPRRHVAYRQARLAFANRAAPIFR